jgi:predicted nuclease of predicted toxin-antitoxin system
MRRAGYDAAHVAELGMANALDGVIWNEAISRSAVLVTKDRDFSLLRAAKRQGPIVLWVRVGNIDNRVLIRQFLAVMPQIVEAVARGEAVIEFVGR